MERGENVNKPTISNNNKNKNENANNKDEANNNKGSKADKDKLSVDTVTTDNTTNVQERTPTITTETMNVKNKQLGKTD